MQWGGPQIVWRTPHAGQCTRPGAGSPQNRRGWPLLAIPIRGAPDEISALADHADIRGLRALPPSGLLVFDLVALVQRLVAVPLNCTVVHEQVLATLIRSNEAVTLLRAEPLHCPCCHTFHLFTFRATNRLFSPLMPL